MNDCKCIRCGLCCYRVRVFKPGRKEFTNPCEHLIHIDELPTCAIHENKPDDCRNYNCWEEPSAVRGITFCRDKEKVF
jgi:hypothetical protein